MIVLEDGPFDVFLHLRGAIHDRYGDDHWVSRGINCELCVSFWVAAIALIAAKLTPFVAWFGVAGAVVIIFEILHVFRQPE